MKITSRVVFAILIFTILPVAAAHTPIEPEAENENLNVAVEILNPTKSWTLYRELHEAKEAEYYKLQLEKGDRLRISLYVPKNEEEVFAPSVVVMGPDISSEDSLPEFIEVPPIGGYRLIESKRPEKPEYEPFTPASYYFLVDFDRQISTGGTYYFAVYDSNKGGRYGLALGYVEEFTLIEWLKIPFDVIKIRQWEGQSILLILSPLIATLIVGLAILKFNFKLEVDIQSLTGASVGLLYLGSGFMTLMQTIISLMGAENTSQAALTAIFIVIPILLGFFLLRKTIGKKTEVSMRERLTMVTLGVIGLFLWAGLLIGPVLAMITAIAPSRRRV